MMYPKNLDNMNGFSDNNFDDSRFLKTWYWAIALFIVCSMPFVLSQFGFDFSSGRSAPSELNDINKFVSVAHHTLRGSFTHTMLEWTAVCCAAFVGMLCLVQYRMTRESSLPVIGVALVCAGAMDAFHTLAADRLIQSEAPNSDLIPFTWAICRMFNACILLVGVGMFAFSGKKQTAKSQEKGVVIISIISLFFVMIAYVIIHLCAISESLPNTMFKDHMIKRPYDIYPLIPYLLCALIVFPKYMSKHRTLFANSLMLSLIPQIAAQLYMAFGSFALHDSNFNIGHSLKAVAYFVPIIGLTAEYIHTFRRQKELAQTLNEQTNSLSDRTVELEVAQAKLRESDEFSRAINQPEKEQTYRRALECLVDTMDLSLAALYVSSDIDELSFECAYGMNRQMLRAEEFSTDGLPMAVFQENKKFSIDGPFDHKLLRVHFGLGEKNLKSVVGWPITFHHRCIGVIVTAHQYPLCENKEKFVTSSLEQLAVRMNGYFLDQQQSNMLVTLESKSNELEFAMKDAEKANRSKSEFLANMSHEIRTPMTAILGFCDILLSQVEEPENLLAAQTIKRNGDYLIGLINDILDLSKIESGKLDVELIPCSACKILSEVASLMRVRAVAKGLPLEIHFEGEIPETIQSDPTRIRQILINLVGNAIKFTEVGKVAVYCKMVDLETDQPQIQFRVVDSGIGMSDVEMSKLFQPFSQGDTSTTRKFGGTGLGLTISKRFIEMLGGEIKINSEIARGTTFIVTFPVGATQNVKMIDSPTEIEDKSVLEKDKFTFQGIPGSRLLLVEDGPDNQRLISFILKKAGAEVVIANNGKIGYELALQEKEKGQPFDVIIMDMQMPVMDGYTATRKLRNSGYSGPIIALTAHGMSGDREKCLSAGCDEYTTKPINRKLFLEIIKNFLPETEPKPVLSSAR